MDNVSGDRLVASWKMDNVNFEISSLNSTDGYEVRHAAYHI